MLCKGGRVRVFWTCDCSPIFPVFIVSYPPPRWYALGLTERGGACPKDSAMWQCLVHNKRVSEFRLSCPWAMIPSDLINWTRWGEGFRGGSKSYEGLPLNAGLWESTNRLVSQEPALHGKLFPYACSWLLEGGRRAILLSALHSSAVKVRKCHFGM